MREIIPITILASDIEVTDFMHWEDCAITRAVQRVGVNGFHDGAHIMKIVDRKCVLVGELPAGITDQVLAMYRNKDTAADIHTTVTLEPVDES